MLKSTSLRALLFCLGAAATLIFPSYADDDDGLDDRGALESAKERVVRQGKKLTLKPSSGKPKTYTDVKRSGRSIEFHLVGYANDVFVVGVLDDSTQDEAHIVFDGATGTEKRVVRQPELSPSAKYFVELKPNTIVIWRRTKRGYSKAWQGAPYARSGELEYDLVDWPSDDRAKMRVSRSHGGSDTTVNFVLSRGPTRWAARRVRDHFVWSYDAASRELTGSKEEHEGDVDFRATCLGGVAELAIGANDGVALGEGQSVTLELKNGRQRVVLRGKSKDSESSEATGGVELRVKVRESNPLFKLLAAPGDIRVSGDQVSIGLPEEGRLERLALFRRDCFAK